MTNLETKSLNNIRHLSIRKKTASRICSTQVLYEASFLINDIDTIIEYYLKNHLIHVLFAVKMVAHGLQTMGIMTDSPMMVSLMMIQYME